MKKIILVFALLLLIGAGCDKATEKKSDNGVTAKAETLKNLEYAKGAGEGLTLDLYLPDRSGKSVPTLIYVHGGGWIEEEGDGPRVCPAEEFVQNGYAVACIKYRLAKFQPNTECDKNYIFPAAVHDTKAAIRWLRKNADTYGLDTNNFGIYGASSGSHLAVLAGVSYGDKYLEGKENLGYSDQVQAIVDWYGPVDYRKEPPKLVFTDDVCKVSFGELIQKYGGEATPFYYWTQAWAYFLGGSLADKNILEQGRLASPVTYLDKNDPPVIVFHGKTDGMISDGQSKYLYAELQKAGIESAFYNLEKAGHGYKTPDGKILKEFFDPTIKFFDKHLK